MLDSLPCNTKSPVTHAAYRSNLKKKILISQKQMRKKVELNNAKIIHRTAARNCKSPHATITDEQAMREDIMAQQIMAWRKILPSLVKKFSRIPDPRRTKSIKHKLVVLMIFGLLAFVFRMSSRREMNRELTGATVNNNLKKIFPELDSIPHADTLARMLEKTNPKKNNNYHH